MSNKKLDFINCFFASQINFIIYYGAVITILGICRQDIFYLPCLCLGGISFLLCLIRVYNNKLWIFYVSHITIFLGGVILPHPNVIYRNVFWLELVVILSYSVYAKIAHKDRSIDRPVSPVVTAVIIIVMHIVQNGYGNEEVLVYYPYIMMLYTIFYSFTRGIDAYQDFLAKNRNSAGYIPEREIFIKSTVGVCCLNVVMAVILILAMQREYTLDFSIIGKGMAAVVYALNKWLQSEENTMMEPVAEETEEVFEMIEEETSLLSAVWDFLDKIVDFLAPFVMAGLFILLVLIIIRAIYQAFGKKEVQTKIYSISVSEQKEKIVSKKQEKTGERKHYFDAAERIRYLYKKAVLKSNNSKASVQTARECMGKIVEDDGDSEMALQFARLYEKARYSQENCTWEDVRQAGRLYRGLRR